MSHPDLVVVIPTLNEAGNVAELASRLNRVLEGIRWEAIFVDDDSTDGTRDELARLSEADPRIHMIHRIGRRGLSSACIEGMLSSCAPYIAIMDADLQHDETLLPAMYRTLARGEADIVVGSRYMDGGGVGDWDAKRRLISRCATRMGQALMKVEITDPMSGFFMLTRPLFERAVRRLSGKGFKLLVDILVSVKEPVRCVELPFVFRLRQAGDSKLDSLIAYEFGLMLYDKMFGHIIPSRFLMFVSAGLIGASLHLSVLWSILHVLEGSFIVAQATATLSAMLLNFAINNIFTHRDLRLRGRRMLCGLASFVAVCSVGGVASTGLGDFLYENSVPWWAAGLLGAVIGAVWNYAVSAVFVWKRHTAR